MPLTPTQQELYDMIRSSLPKFFFQKDGATEELWGLLVKMFDSARLVVDDWRALTLIGTATDIWLDQHARDRALFRQLGELDPALRIRIRTFADAVNRPSILDAINQVLVAQGVTVPSGYPAMVELRHDRAHFTTDTASGFKRAFFSRGYRMGDSTHELAIIVILPYGTSAAVAALVSEVVLNKRAGGFPHVVERRTSP
jgi:hypothetical protein